MLYVTEIYKSESDILNDIWILYMYVLICQYLFTKDSYIWYAIQCRFTIDVLMVMIVCF